MLPNSLGTKRRSRKSALATVKQGFLVSLLRRFAPALMLGAAVVVAAGGVPALADDTVQLSVTMKDHQFDPAELQAPLNLAYRRDEISAAVRAFVGLVRRSQAD